MSWNLSFDNQLISGKEQLEYLKQVYKPYTYFSSSSWPLAWIYIAAASNGIVDTPRAQAIIPVAGAGRVNKVRSKYARAA